MRLWVGEDLPKGKKEKKNIQGVFFYLFRHKSVKVAKF